MFSKTSFLLLIIALVLISMATITVGLYLDSKSNLQEAQNIGQENQPSLDASRPSSQVPKTDQSVAKESNPGEKPDGEGWVLDEEYLYTKDCRVEVIDKWSVYPENLSGSNSIEPYLEDVGYYQRGIYHGPPVEIGLQYEIEEGFTTQTFLGVRFTPVVITEGYVFTIGIHPNQPTTDPEKIRFLEQKGFKYIFSKPPDDWKYSCVVYSNDNTYTKNCRMEVVSKEGVYPGDDSSKEGIITYLYVLGYAQKGIYHGPPAIIEIQYISKNGHIMQNQYNRVVTEGQDFPAHIATTDPEYIKLLEQKGITYIFHQPPNDWQTSINVTLK